MAFACANGSTPVLLDDGDGIDSGVSTLPPTNGKDSGTNPPEEDAATPEKDAAVQDSSVKDSSTADSSPPTANGDCVGTQSAQLSTSYDMACDNFYFNTFGDSNPCSMGANNCAALNDATYTYCCFKPAFLSDCYIDYFGQSQCIPK